MSPTNKPHIVLAGGGHAHVLALPLLAKSHRLTLVSEQPFTPYSGMLPGYLYGVYKKDELFINLKQLARTYGVTWCQERIIGIDKKQLLFASGKKIEFDFLSINTGSVSLPYPQSTDNGNACAVRPITSFIDWCDTIDDTAITSLCIVGAGAGAFELALAFHARWQSQKTPPRITMIGRQLLPTFPPSAQKIFHKQLAQRNIRLIEDTVKDYDSNRLTLHQSGQLDVENVIWVNGVCAPSWLENTPLMRDEQGFICVNHFLQSTNRSDIFVAGDVASHPEPLPRAGVMATRQSKPLATNLQAIAMDAPLSQWRHRHNPLYIINTADGKAVACLHGYTLSGHWVWRWKNYLDTRFMNKFKV